jgi:hypothetical protein
MLYQLNDFPLIGIPFAYGLELINNFSPNISWKFSRGLFIGNENRLLFTILLIVVR